MVVALFSKYSLDVAAVEVDVVDWKGMYWKWMPIGRRCGGEFTRGKVD